MATGLLLLYLLVTTLLISSATPSPTQLLLPLTHTLPQSLTHNSTHHLLKSSSLRSSARFRTHRHPHHQNRQVSLPLSPGSDYTLSLSLGPTTTVNLYMDTGSDLVWFPCSPFECILCEGKTQPLSPPPSPPANSTIVSCDDPSCSAAHSSLPSSDLCAMSGCHLDAIETSSCPSSSRCPQFYYAYGDGSLIARLRRGPLSLNSLSVPNFTFACAHTALAEPIGVAGFGRGILSLPNQLSSLSPSLGSRFSYCLISHSFQPNRLLQPSPLILGRSSGPTKPEDSPFIYTSILHNPKYPYFYSVGLEAISVGQTIIPARPNLMSVDREGNGGMVVDSGTTFTMLPSDLYYKLTDKFASGMKKAGFKRAVETETETGLGPCYYYERRNERRRVPSLGLHFAGNASVELPRRNYFLGLERGGKKVGCLMVMNGGDDDGEDSGGPAGTLGNFQHQGFEVVYDLAKGRVGFARRRCADLWDSLSRG